MDQLYDRVAGLDVHRDNVVGCFRRRGPRGGVVREKERFTTTTAGLRVLEAWLAERQVELVAMEATGVYWKPVYYALESEVHGVAVQRSGGQEGPGSQDRYERFGMAGGRGCARDDPA